MAPDDSPLIETVYAAFGRGAIAAVLDALSDGAVLPAAPPRRA